MKRFFIVLVFAVAAFTNCYSNDTIDLVCENKIYAQVIDADMFDGRITYSVLHTISETLSPFYKNGGFMHILIKKSSLDDYVIPSFVYYSKEGKQIKALLEFNETLFQYRETDKSIILYKVGTIVVYNKARKGYFVYRETYDRPTSNIEIDVNINIQ